MILTAQLLVGLFVQFIERETNLAAIFYRPMRTKTSSQQQAESRLTIDSMVFSGTLCAIDISSLQGQQLITTILPSRSRLVLLDLATDRDEITSQPQDWLTRGHLFKVFSLMKLGCGLPSYQQAYIMNERSDTHTVYFLTCVQEPQMSAAAAQFVSWKSTRHEIHDKTQNNTSHNNSTVVLYSSLTMVRHESRDYLLKFYTTNELVMGWPASYLDESNCQTSCGFSINYKAETNDPKVRQWHKGCSKCVKCVPIGNRSTTMGRQPQKLVSQQVDHNQLSQFDDTCALVASLFLALLTVVGLIFVSPNKRPTCALTLALGTYIKVVFNTRYNNQSYYKPSIEVSLALFFLLISLSVFTELLTIFQKEDQKEVIKRLLTDRSRAEKLIIGLLTLSAICYHLVLLLRNKPSKENFLSQDNQKLVKSMFNQSIGGGSMLGLVYAIRVSNGFSWPHQMLRLCLSVVYLLFYHRMIRLTREPLVRAGKVSFNIMSIDFCILCLHLSPRIFMALTKKLKSRRKKGNDLFQINTHGLEMRPASRPDRTDIQNISSSSEGSSPPGPIPVNHTPVPPS